MQYREIGTSGIQASVVGLGTWAVGGGPWWGTTDDDESIDAIQAAIDEGVSLIDTAPIYGFGRSEEVVGRAIRGRRDKIVLATKTGLWWDDESGVKWFDLGDHTVRRCLSPDVIRREIEMSLKRLQTDCIDLYQTHWQSLQPEAEPIADTMECLLKLKQEGKIRAIGVSNCTPAQMQEYLAVGRIDSNQPKYSMLDRQIEKELLPWCRDHSVSILAYSPLEQGLLTGKIGMDYELSETEYRKNIPWMRPENRKRVLAMLDGWKELTNRYDCTLAQLVIAWTVAQPGVTFALCGARKRRHALENAKAGDLNLSGEDLARMRSDVEGLGQPS